MCMAVMGFQKKVWIGGELYPVFILDFWNLFNFAKRLTPPHCGSTVNDPDGYISPFAAVFLCGVAGLAETFPSLPVAHSSLILQSFMSLLTVSLHLNLGLPLGRFPSIFILAISVMFPVSCLLFNVPKPFLLLTIRVGTTLASSKIFLFF